MATYDELMTALRNADAQGDRNAARRLATLARQAREQELKPSEQPQASQAGDEPRTTDNVLTGAYKRLTAIGGSALRGLERLRRFRKDTLGLPGIPGTQGIVDTVNGMADDLQAEADATPEFRSTASGSARRLVDGELTMDNALGAIREGAESLVTSSPDMAAAMLPPAWVPYLIGRSNELAEQRASNDGRVEPELSDALASVPAAVGSMALDRFGGKGMLTPRATSIPGKFAEGVAKEAVTEGVQNVIEDVGTRAGTTSGLGTGETLKNAAAAAITGGAAGGTARSTALAAQATSATARAITNRVAETGLAKHLEEDPETFGSLMRTAAEYDREKGELLAQDPKAKVQDSIVFRNLRDRYSSDIENFVQALYEKGEIDESERKAILKTRKGILSHADSTQRYLNRVSDLGQLDGMLELGAGNARMLRDALIDLDTVSHASIDKRAKGPVEALLSTSQSSSRMAVAGVTGGAVAGVPGAIAGTAGAYFLPKVGRAVDKALGLRVPASVRRAQARIRVAQKTGFDPALGLRGDLANKTAKLHKEAESPFVKEAKPRHGSASPKLASAEANIADHLKAKETPRLGGWRVAMKKAAKDTHGVRLGDDAIDAALAELHEAGVLTDRQFADAQKPGLTIRSKPLFYGINDLAIQKANEAARAKRLAKAAAMSEAEKTKRSDAAKKAAETRRQNKATKVAEVQRIREELGAMGAGIPSITDATPLEGVRNALSYAQAMKGIAAATSTAVNSAPSDEVRALVLRIANTKDKTAKAEVFDGMASRFPELTPWLETVVKPLTEFGPSKPKASSKPKAASRPKATAKAKAKSRKN
ncbi:MAG: hypothetical protein R3D03_10290 [Geminicoccaceae bacterium]